MQSPRNSEISERKCTGAKDTRRARFPIRDMTLFVLSVPVPVSKLFFYAHAKIVSHEDCLTGAVLLSLNFVGGRIPVTGDTYARIMLKSDHGYVSCRGEATYGCVFISNFSCRRAEFETTRREMARENYN